MMSKTAKKNYIEEMKKNFSSNESVMIAQYQGLNVNELDELRKELRERSVFPGYTSVLVRPFPPLLLAGARGTRRRSGSSKYPTSFGRPLTVVMSPSGSNLHQR